ncbi:MAG: AMP-binding protein [Gammaproteobacteria bacterium]|nr:AMP-binding protein [Gammaproteobacteria bacterium]
MDLVFKGHAYYKRVLAERSLTRADFASLDDLVKLPLTWKKDYMAAPQDFVLKVDDLPEEMRVIWDTMHTTGTTGKPTPFVQTTYDFYNILTINRRALEIRGVRPTDLVANLFPLTIYPYGAYIRTIHACTVMNIPVVNLTPGRPSPYFHWSSEMAEVVATIARVKATILWGVASYVRRVILAAEEARADFSSVRLCFVTGEAVTEAMRADMTSRLERLGATAPWVSVSYGATEMQVGTVECAPGAGYHNPGPEEFHFSVVDPDTHRPVPDGTRGLVVLTHLNRRGTILLRYAMGDTSVITRERCPHCGSHTDRLIELPQRADDLVKVRGMLINPGAIGQALVGDVGVAEYQLVIDRETPGDPLSMDTLLVRVARDGADADLRDRVVETVRRVAGVRADVEIVAMSQIYDPERSMKSKRLVDRRKEQ